MALPRALTACVVVNLILCLALAANVVAIHQRAFTVRPSLPLPLPISFILFPDIDRRPTFQNQATLVCTRTDRQGKTLEKCQIRFKVNDWFSSLVYNWVEKLVHSTQSKSLTKTRLVVVEEQQALEVSILAQSKKKMFKSIV